MQTIWLKYASAAVLMFAAACTTTEPEAYGPEDKPDAFAQLTQDLKPDVLVSDTAKSTQASEGKTYNNASEMIENADMYAFLTDNRQAYLDGEKEGGWGFVAVDQIAANAPEAALAILKDMPDYDKSGKVMSAAYLRPWVLAANDRGDDAVEAMEKLEDAPGGMPNHVWRGHYAAMLEGMSRIDDALEVYERGPDVFDRPGDDEEPSGDTINRALTFGAERQLALRHAELLYKIGRKSDALSVYKALLDADENDHYSIARIEEITEDEQPENTLDLKQAMAVALNDQANMIDEQQMLVQAIMTRGAEAPFNHLVSSLRQAALLVDPKSAGIRQVEAEHLYEHGFFEASARLAMSGETSPDDLSSLLLTAADSRLELNELERVQELVGEALKNADEYTLLSAADLLVRSDAPERALDLIVKARGMELSDNLHAYALMLKAEAHQQDGDMLAAVSAAREAVKVDESESTNGFLASMLSNHATTREEGLKLYRRLFLTSPDNPGMMNNFGYSLVVNPETPDELDEGFRLLKKANRVTPFEPNLLDSLGWAYYQYGEYERALVLIEKALDAYKPFSHWELHEHLGDVHWRLGNENTAKDAWRDALNARPPKHRRKLLEKRLDSGLTEPAPKKRVPPAISNEDKRQESSTI